MLFFTQCTKIKSSIFAVVLLFCSLFVLKYGFATNSRNVHMNDSDSVNTLKGIYSSFTDRINIKTNALLLISDINITGSDENKLVDINNSLPEQNKNKY
ncbi:MAG: hypothetical protein ABIT08_15245 [Bacteroidia bacterium]